MLTARFVPHSLGAPAEQPDTVASAGDMGQVAREVLNSNSSVLPGSLLAAGQGLLGLVPPGKGPGSIPDGKEGQRARPGPPTGECTGPSVHVTT